MRSGGRTYSCPDLVHCMRAGQIAHFVRVSDRDAEAWLCRLLDAHAGLAVSLVAVASGERWLHGRGNARVP